MLKGVLLHDIFENFIKISSKNEKKLFDEP